MCTVDVPTDVIGNIAVTGRSNDAQLVVMAL